MTSTSRLRLHVERGPHRTRLTYYTCFLCIFFRDSMTIEYVRTHIYACTHICNHKCTHTHTHKHQRTHTHTCLHTHIKRHTSERDSPRLQLCIIKVHTHCSIFFPHLADRTCSGRIPGSLSHTCHTLSCCPLLLGPLCGTVAMAGYRGWLQLQ